MMSSTETKPSLRVRKVVTVAAPREIAFEVFTAEMSSWWPLQSHHIGKANAVAAVIEPRVGGRWFERGEDGSECEWGRVLAYDPPSGLVLSWEISAEWQHDARLKTVVEVRFIAEGAGKTRVELEHRDLESFGARAEEMRAIFDSAGGWGGMLESYAKAASARHS